MRPGACCVLLLLLVSMPASAETSADPLLITSLDKLAPETLLEVTMRGGSRYVGHLAGMAGGHLLVRPTPDSAVQLTAWRLPPEDVLRIRHRSSGAGRGFKTGFTTGAMLGGGLSLLWGIALDSIDGEGGNIGAIAGFTMAGTLVGGLGVGIVGSGIGALSDVWTTDYEAPEALPLPHEETLDTTRMGLGFGVASADEKDVDYHKTALYGNVRLQRPLGARFDFGPEIGYYDLDGVIRRRETNYYSYTSVSSVLTLGLASLFQSRKAGWAPYLVLGTGYYIGGGEYLGISVGGGVRYRTAGRQDVKFEIRHHFNVYEGEHADHLDHFATFGANFSFDL